MNHLLNICDMLWYFICCAFMLQSITDDITASSVSVPAM